MPSPDPTRAPHVGAVPAPIGLPRVVPRGLAPGSAAALVTLVALACSPAESRAAEPAVERLAAGFEPDAGVRGERPWSECDPRLTLVAGARPGTLWVRVEPRPDDWRRYARVPQLWSFPRLMIGNGDTDGERTAPRLVVEGRELSFVPLEATRLSRQVLQPGRFFLVRSRVLAALENGHTAPASAELSELVDLGLSIDGVNRVVLGPFAGEGFVLAPGIPARIARRAGGPAVLRFLATTKQRSEPTRAPKLRVELDGRILAELALDEPVSAEIPLPAAERTAELAFSCQGPPALCAVLAPVLAPPAASAPARPDLVLFVADTFRADNLAAYGAEAEIAPNLDRFAGEAACFASTFSTASWTLPAHASMFTGLLPHQARVTSASDRLSEDAVTLAEVLQRAGYRTGAITDGAFLAPEYGLAQGFECYDARRKQPEETLAAVRAFLARDDGRPAFLLVHSYRAHHPYVPDPEASAETLRALGVRADVLPGELAAVPASIEGWSEGWVASEAQAQRMRDYAAHYRAASAALDRLFGETRALLARRPAAARTILVFTSDHGEAFWEHGAAEHGNGVWNEHLRVPLLVAGPRIARGVSTRPASLLDLPRTLAALAGVEPHPTWGGVDLFAAGAPRTLLAFQCDQFGRPTALALIDGDRKLVASEAAEGAGELLDAFDLALDPAERVDRADEAWARRLFAEQRAALEHAMRPLLTGATAAPSRETIEDLGALGYQGDEQR